MGGPLGPDRDDFHASMVSMYSSGASGERKSTNDFLMPWQPRELDYGDEDDDTSEDPDDD